MGGQKGVTEKINAALDQSSNLMKFLLQIVAVISIVSGIILYPLKSKLDNIERNVDDLKARIETKVDKETLDLKLKNLDEKLDAIGKKVDRIDNWLMRGNRP